MITIFVHGAHYARLGMVQADTLAQCARIADERYPGHTGYALGVSPRDAANRYALQVAPLTHEGTP